MHLTGVSLAFVTLGRVTMAAPYSPSAMAPGPAWDWRHIAREAMLSPVGDPTQAYEKWAGMAREAAPPTKKREAEAWQTEARRQLPDKRAPASAKRDVEASPTTSSTIPLGSKRGTPDKRAPTSAKREVEALPTNQRAPTPVALPTEAKRAVPDMRAPELMARDSEWSTRAIEPDPEAAMQKRQCYITLDGEQYCNMGFKRSIEGGGNELEKRMNMTRRSDGHVCIYFTDEYNWNGNASNLCSLPGQCMNISWPLSGHVSSAGPSQGQDCSLYSEPDCRGEHLAGLQYPGSPDLRGIGFDKTARSWICYDKPQFESTPAVKSRADSPPASGRRGEDKRESEANLDMSNLQNGLAEMLGRLDAPQRFGGSGWKREAGYGSDTPTNLLARGWSKKREPSAGYASHVDWHATRRSDEELETSGESSGDDIQDVPSEGGSNHEKRFCRTWRGFPVCI